MKITQETPLETRSIQIRIDPHDGSCHGNHDIVLVAVRTPPTFSRQYYCSLTWGPSALLGVSRSREFAEAILKACDIADRIATDGAYRP